MKKSKTLVAYLLGATLTAGFMQSCQQNDEPQVQQQVKLGSVAGKVLSANGTRALGGVKVVCDVNGEVYYTLTNHEGEFSLNVPEGQQTIIIHSGSGKLFRTSFSVMVSAGRETRMPSSYTTLDLASNLAHIPGAFDHIEGIITDLGYTSTEISVADLANPSLLANYDAIFLNCGKSDVLDSAKYSNLKQFVMDGGSLYASDWAVEYLTGDGNFRSDAHSSDAHTRVGCEDRVGGFISETMLCTYKGGPGGLVTSAEIVSTDLQTALGKTEMDVDYDMGGWEIIDVAGEGVEVLIRDNVTYGPLAVRTSMASSSSGCSTDYDPDADFVTICHIPPGSPDHPITITVGAAAVPAHLAHGCCVGSCGGDGGSIIYTTFHNHHMGDISDDVYNILEYFILSL